MEIGFSIYLDEKIYEINNLIKKANSYGCKFAFTSLNIEEYHTDIEILKKINNLCNDLNINLIVDINAKSKNKILSNEYNNIYYRIDDGFSIDDIILLSKNKKIVLNASTIKEPELKYLFNNGVDFNNIFCMHNFYPKKFTGISKDFLIEKNKLFHKYNIKVMAFSKGDNLRGPIFEGLPTIEEHRNKRFLESVLDLNDAKVDIIFIGDKDLSDENWKDFNDYHNNIIPIRTNNNILPNLKLKNRCDSSIYLIRNSTNIGGSREKFKNFILNELGDFKKIKKDIEIGDILLSNDNYLRYSGEIEIALKNIGIDDKRDVISQVIKKDIPLLKYIKNIENWYFKINN